MQMQMQVQARVLALALALELELGLEPGLVPEPILQQLVEPRESKESKESPVDRLGFHRQDLPTRPMESVTTNQHLCFLFWDD